MPTSTDRVTVFGGTGFLGRSIVRQLVDAGRPVRVATRHPLPAQTDGIEPVLADVRDEAAVGAAMDGGGHSAMRVAASIATIGSARSRRRELFFCISGLPALTRL